ncbi:DUF2911 domain-containing protein [Olivibacter sitiensis]|uniref:DUF2911 domain-containing protein n=1 Tax=Olivibacter sitiensis TaxID=376470 RepID=UPI0003FDB56B|nr:DUF2911 domain-containing protein [Olivibacter sitiensis]
MKVFSFRNLFAFGIVLGMIVLGLQDSLAQGQLFPSASTAQSIEQELGISKVSLHYARPNMKGRKIFGALIPYDQVWRTGANNATTITFHDEVALDGKKVPAGTYALFTIPRKTEWTIILNKNSKQWGAYTYDEKDDLLRFNVPAEKLKKAQETFEITFSEISDKTAKLTLAWEKVAVSFDIVVDQDAKIMANIAEAMKGEKKPYLGAAQYYYNNNKDLDQALVWANEAVKQSPKAPHTYYWKALIQLKAGDKAGANATASEGKKLAETAGNSEYVTLNQQVIDKSK